MLLQLSNSSFAYESVPLNIRRRFGRIGGAIATTGTKSAEIGWLASNPAYHAARRLATRTIGSATHFEPEQVLERMAASIRLILRDEDVALLVNEMIAPLLAAWRQQHPEGVPVAATAGARTGQDE